MKDIRDYIGGSDERRLAKFREAIKGKSNEQVWELRLKFLRPRQYPKYVGKDANPEDMVKNRTVQITAPDMESFNLLKKHFRVSKHVRNSIARPELLFLLVNLLEEGVVVYNEKKKSLFVRRKNN